MPALRRRERETQPMWQEAIGVIVAMLVIELASDVVSAQDAGHGPETSATSTPSSPLFDDADLDFMQHMIVHHQQALVMADLVPARTERDEFIRFASYVRRAQAAEIESMQSLLDLAADRGMVVGGHDLHGDPPMGGMLSRARVDALAAATGVDFERLWLEGMIYHHQGAIDMAQAQQRHQLQSGRQPYEISVLVEEILIEQQAEITKMRAWLAK